MSVKLPDMAETADFCFLFVLELPSELCAWSGRPNAVSTAPKMGWLRITGMASHQPRTELERGRGQKIKSQARKHLRIVLPGLPVKFYPLTNSGNRIREATSISGGVIMALGYVGFVAHVGICHWYKWLSGSSHQKQHRWPQARRNPVSRGSASLQKRQGTTHKRVHVQKFPLDY